MNRLPFKPLQPPSAAPAPSASETGRFVPSEAQDDLPPERFEDYIPDPAGVGSPIYDPDVERAKKSVWGEEARTPYSVIGKALAPNLTLDDLKALGSTTVRSGARAVAGLPFMPIDAATGVANFVRQGDYSREAFLRGMNPFAAGSPEDYQGPSQRLDQILDQYTVAPSTTGGRVAEAISSGVLGARLPGLPQPAPRPAVTPTPADLAKVAGERHGVPTFFDDLTKNPFWKKISVAAENVPFFGTASGRAKQMEAAKQAATRVTGRYAADLEDETVPVLMQEGMQRRLQALKGSAAVLYDRAGRLLDPEGYVPTPQFNRALNQELIYQTERGSMANPRVVELLEQFRHAPGGNFTRNRQLRSDLNDAIRDFYVGGKNAAIGEKGVERLRLMREGLEADMNSFAQRVGGGADRAWREANAFWRTNLLPFKERGFAELVRTAEPEKAWQYLLAQGGKESRAERMYRGLDTQGRATVRAGLLQEAMEKAVTPKKNFSPAQFAKYMEDHEAVVNQFFHGNELQEIRGFTNLMRHVERAGQYMENPPTGQRLTAAALLGIGSWEPSVAGGIAGTALAVKTLMQSQRGRDLLIAASKLKPGSPAMGTITDQIRLITTRAAASAPAEAEKERLQLVPVGEVTGEPVEKADGGSVKKPLSMCEGVYYESGSPQHLACLQRMQGKKPLPAPQKPSEQELRRRGLTSV